MEGGGAECCHGNISKRACTTINQIDDCGGASHPKPWYIKGLPSLAHFSLYPTAFFFLLLLAYCIMARTRGISKPAATDKLVSDHTSLTLDMSTFLTNTNLTGNSKRYT